MTAPIHFLHIGKTGGTALQSALGPLAASYGLALHGHETILRDIPEDQGVVFFIRHPITRFVSAFNSRLRMGRPRYDVRWTPEEEIAFATFKVPNELAEALSSEDEGRREAAAAAMQGISHVKSPMGSWLESESYVEARRASIVYIGLQETLDEDFAKLRTILGLPDSVRFPTDGIEAHVTPAGYDKTLSPLGMRNIARWYERDVALYEFLTRFRSLG